MGIEYRKSQFNYISHNKNGYFIYNTLYDSLTGLSQDEYRQYALLDFDSEEIKKEFASQGIIVDKNADELKRYNIYTQLASEYSDPRPCITVTPTMECNARCFYCYEEGVRYGRMDKDSADRIIETIKTIDLSRGIRLTWFGGEPLMNQGWMDYFSERLRAESIDFSAFIISNGSKINDDVIVQMKNIWNIGSIQITFDGSCDEYIRRKAYTDQDEKIYYQMLKKIRNLSKAGILVQIRLNIDRNNIESIMEMASDMVQLYGTDDNVSCYPAFLTGGDSPLSEREKIDIIKKIIEICGDMLPVNNYLYKLPKSHACYYNCKTAFSIDTNGDIFLCERMLGHSQRAVGNVKEHIDLSKIRRELSGRRPECQKCVFLPKCHGGCYDAYINNEIPCFIDKYIIKAYLELL